MRLKIRKIAIAIKIINIFSICRIFFIVNVFKFSPKSLIKTVRVGDPDCPQDNQALVIVLNKSVAKKFL